MMKYMDTIGNVASSFYSLSEKICRNSKFFVLKSMGANSDSRLPDNCLCLLLLLLLLKGRLIIKDLANKLN